MGPAFSHISGPSGIYRDKLAGMFLFDMSCLWASYRPIWNISNLQQWPYYILQVPLNFLDLLQSLFLIPLGKQMLFWKLKKKFSTIFRIWFSTDLLKDLKSLIKSFVPFTLELIWFFSRKLNNKFAYKPKNSFFHLLLP